MGRAPKEAECAEGGFEECAAYVEAKLVLFIEWKEEQRAAWSSSERKVMGQWKIVPIFKVDVEALERLMEPEEVVAAIFSSTSTEKRKRTISWQAENDGWRVRERRYPCKKVGKMSGMTLSIKE